MQFLLERLNATPRGLDGRPEAFDEVAAIIAQVQRIAATGRHAGPDIPAVPWGMAAVTTIGATATVQLRAYADALAVAIARHEPRLRHVRVDLAHAGGALMPWGLCVTALFPGDDQPRDVHVPAPY